MGAMEGDTPLRQLPSVESLLQRLEADGALAAYPRGLVVAAARDAVARARTALREGRGAGAPVSVEGLVDDARGLLARRAAPSLVSAVNATGIIIHPNLGRAPLCDAAREAAAGAAGYAVVELDHASESRGARQHPDHGIV